MEALEPASVCATRARCARRAVRPRSSLLSGSGPGPGPGQSRSRAGLRRPSRASAASVDQPTRTQFNHLDLHTHTVPSPSMATLRTSPYMTPAAFDERLAKWLTSSGASSINSPAFAKAMDASDQLASFRSFFNVPSHATVAGVPLSPTAPVKVEHDRADDSVYLAGNSLGLMPKLTPALIQQELAVWAHSGVMGHVDHPHERPWVKIDECVTPTLARIVGASVDEVACMGSLTANVHLLLTAFYKPTEKRHKILYEGKAFPSDSVSLDLFAATRRRRRTRARATSASRTSELTRDCLTDMRSTHSRLKWRITASRRTRSCLCSRARASSRFGPRTCST